MLPRVCKVSPVSGLFLPPAACGLHRARRRWGLTLIELIVAMSILSLLIVLTGEAFSQVGKATEQVEYCLRCNDSILALETQLRRDLAQVTPDGPLVIGGDPSNPNTQSMLLMTVTGHFVSQTDVQPGGAAVTADAALIVYTLATPVAASRPQMGRVLCRYAYLLAGDGRSPRGVSDLSALGPAFNALTSSDVLGDSLSDLRMKDRLTAASAYYRPALYGATPAGQRINLAPTSGDDRSAGGVRQLWPAMFPGCQSITWEFCDGMNEDGVTPTLGPSQWFSPASTKAC
jgi:prepilin-type N-terminal cleavage/methylation domain-containing protein